METTVKINAEQAKNISESRFTPAPGMQMVNVTPSTFSQSNTLESFQKCPLWIGHILAQFLQERKQSKNNPTKLSKL